MDCLNPPLEQEPPGTWYCPICAQTVSELPAMEQTLSPEVDFIASCPPPPPIREVSVASSSRSAGLNGAARNQKKGKARALTTDESEVDVDDTKTPTRSSRRKSTAKGKAPIDGPLRVENEAEAEEDPLPGSSRPNKRPRVRLSVPPPKPPTIRLRLPPRAKGKERAEDPDENRRGMFDDLLPAEDRDVGATVISHSDKLRFDKSRSLADVRHFVVNPIYIC